MFPTIAVPDVEPVKATIVGLVTPHLFRIADLASQADDEIASVRALAGAWFRRFVHSRA